MNDDITRLADKIRKACETANKNGFDIPPWDAGAWEAELRTLAQQGKAGGVPVDQAMISRALNCQPFAPAMPDRAWQILKMPEANAQLFMETVLTAALAPQPKDAT